MIQASSEEKLAVAPEVAFDFVADPANEPLWNPDAVSCHALDPALGPRSPRRSEYRHIGRVDTEVVEFVRPGRLVLHSAGRQAEMTLEFLFEPSGDGTHMQVEGHLQMKGPLRFAERALRGQVIEQYAKRAALIKHHLDGSSRP